MNLLKWELGCFWSFSYVYIIIYVLTFHCHIKSTNVWIRWFIRQNRYLIAPRPSLGHYREDSPTHPMLITAFLHFRPKCRKKPRNEIGSLNPAKRPVGFEPGTFRFWLDSLNPLACSFQQVLRQNFGLNIYLSI